MKSPWHALMAIIFSLLSGVFTVFAVVLFGHSLYRYSALSMFVCLLCVVAAYLYWKVAEKFSN